MRRKVFLAGVLGGAVALADQDDAQWDWSIGPAACSDLAAEITKME